MWALEENRNSNGETDESFCKPSKRQLWVWAENGSALLHCLSQKEFQDRAALPEISVSMGCYTSSSEAKPWEKGQPKPHSPFAISGYLQTDPPHSHSSQAQRGKRTSGRPCSSKGWWHWHGAGTRSTVRLQNLCSNFPIILTHPMSPSTESSAAWLMWNMPFCSLCWFFKIWEEEPGQCNYRKTMFKRPISSANEIGFFAVVVSLVRRRDGMNFVCSSNSEGQRKKKHQACFWRASPGLQVLRSQLGMLAQPRCFLSETLIQSTALFSYPNTSSRPEDHVFWEKKVAEWCPGLCGYRYKFRIGSQSSSIQVVLYSSPR